MNRAALAVFLAERMVPSYRMAQALDVFTRGLGESWEAVTSWPKALRDEVVIAVPWDDLVAEQVLVSKEMDAVKFLLRCLDGKEIETVIMRHENGRNTVCVSSQVGCPMKCAFCATGKMGLIRSLTADEIFEQVIQASRWLKKEVNGKVSNVVYMGMGEPMNNYDAVMASIRMLNDPKGIGIGVRHLSISTCGIVPGILKLADEPEQVNLAISLHSAVQKTRSSLMPVNAAYPIEKLMAAVETYTEKTNRKVLFEYLLLDGINDTRGEAEALADLLSSNRRLYQVNLLKYHDTHAFKATSSDERGQFMQWLIDRGIPVTIRHSFGEDILAACGQLAVMNQ
jgi:23S rRNA (adenine2503-C2)-methyltransferase